ncbi:cytochrome P450 [Panaeolus papilionaceus]|nr:cytochrome P450 [Panaeolus papilionaceus]
MNSRIINELVSTSTRLLGLLGVTITVYGASKLVAAIYRELSSPLRLLRGPPSKSFVLGNFREIWDTGNDLRHEEWVKTYGSTFKYKGLFGVTRLYTVDLKAINHVAMNNYVYQKPEAAVYNLKQVTGDSGVLLVEGDAHKLQRKILNPAFGAQQMREITGVVFDKTIQLRDAWLTELSSTQEAKRIDALSWLSRATLDVIGLTGFNYDFEALTPDGPERNELNKAFKTLFETGGELSIPAVLRGLFPIFRFLPVPGDAEANIASRNMFR